MARTNASNKKAWGKICKRINVSPSVAEFIDRDLDEILVQLNDVDNPDIALQVIFDEVVERPFGDQEGLLYEILNPPTGEIDWDEFLRVYLSRVRLLRAYRDLPDTLDDDDLQPIPQRIRETLLATAEQEGLRRLDDEWGSQVLGA